MSKKNGLESSTSRGKSEASETTPLVAKVGDNGEDPELNKNGGGGLSVKQTALLVVGEIAGGGVLALPRALVKTGWLGVPLLLLICLMAAFSGKRLGDCWSLIEARDPQMRTRKRNPYAIIAEQALGKTWSAAVSVALVVTQFGVAVVYLLLAAQIIQQLFLALVPTMTLCLWYLIVTGAMTPLLLFGTPKDFSFLGTIAFFATVIACVLYFIQMMNDIRPFVFRWGIHGFKDFFLAVGIMMFAFNGASTFPTIQNDMADKTKFNKSLQYSFAAIMAIYLPISIAGYAVYGESVGPNFITSLTATPLTLVANVLMAIQLVSAFIISINPVCQEMEEMYNIPRDSIGHRILVRVSIMAGIMFIGESIPRFYTVLALVGATSIGLLTFILPCYCFLKLDNQPPAEGQVQSETPGWSKLLCWQVVIVGAVGAIIATYAAISAIFSTSQATPCYLK
ncbi:amino acid transporter AVT1B-like [Aricia agestis]|uniref:amino acid transporter AVT1B-like n=1 Tax=Aricia agestis TaxID=91739 RepID=UPI001C2087DC|nr:amino acid transporter AVT1B-like [Aricia agestis]XP_041986568.1 amino acid transporter AVT1B-like [Aricia agestis]